MMAMAAATTTAAKPNRSAPEVVTLVRTSALPTRSGQGWSQHARRAARLAFASAVALTACAPKATSTPLGMGPLALAERQTDAAEAHAAQKKAARKPTAHSAKPSPTPAPKVSLDPDEDDANDDDSEPTAQHGKAGSGTGEAKGFNGVYAGKDIAIFRITGVPERQELDEHARLRIESESGNTLRITLINSENGSDLCQLSAEVQGNSAQLESDQPCFTSEEEGAIQAQLTSGKVVLSGDRLRMDAEGTLSVTLGDEELEGDLSYSFKGDRQ
jgi:hypothetical protein